MRAKTFQRFYSVGAVPPYLWGFAAASALDYIIDVQTLFLPVMAGAAVVSAGSVVLRTAGR
jgi:hypothetical protein